MMRRLLLSLACLSLLAACSSGGGDTTTPPAPASITLSASSSAGTVALNAASTTTLTIARLGAYAGTVTLSATGAPAGVSISFTPTTLTGSTVSSIATIAVSSPAVAGASTITFRADGAGVTSQTVAYTLTISAPQTPAITVALGASTASAPQGASATVPVTITRSGGAGDVTLTAEGLPTGVTATFNPSSLTGAVTASTLTLAVAANAATGASSIVVRASAAGATSQTATVSLTVTAAGTPSYSIAAAPAALSVVAGQSGTSTLTIAPSGGFSGSVSLAIAAAGLPAGVTAAFVPNPTTTTSTLTLTTTAAAVPATYNLTVTGTATGQADRTVAIALTVTAPAGLSLALSPNTLSIVQGTTGQSTVTLTRVGSLSADVALTTTGAPTGMTVAFVPATLSGATLTSAATVTVGSSVAAGIYPVSVVGTAGALTSSATLTVTVTAAASGGFTLAATGASGAQGASPTSTITITRTAPFTGTVNLTAPTLPANVTASFNPPNVAGTTSTLTFAIGANAAPGSYSVTVTGTGTGVATQTVTVPLTITSSGGGGGGSIAYRFCDATAIPTFFAFRNGSSGAWTAVTVGANNTFSFSLSASTGQVAYAIGNGASASVNVFYYAASEFPTVAAQQCVSNPATKSVTGTVAGLATGQSATISMGGGAVGVQANGSFTLTKANDGATDLIATRTSLNLATFSQSVDKVIIRRGINPAANGSVGAVLDFGSAEALTPASALYTIVNVNGETVNGLMSFSTANGGSASFFNFSSTSTNPVSLSGVPSSATQAGDLHAAVVLATTTVGALTTQRAAYQYNRDVAARTLTLGPAATTPTVTSSGSSPYARPKVQGNWQTEYGDQVIVTLTQGSNARSWTITATRAFFGSSASSYELEVPDLSGLTGFLTAWGLLPGTSTSFGFNIYGGLAGITAITEGLNFRIATRSTTITP